MENNEITIIENAQQLQAVSRAEIDSQIATAKAYPRNLSAVINNVRTIATVDMDTAASCFYSLRRDGKVIEGPSIRMAEIICSSYGNIRVQSRIIANDGKTITAQGVCHDLETNYAVSEEVKVRITTRDGRTYSDDMQTMAGNAARSKAMRNAVFKVVPMAMFNSILKEVKQVSIGAAADLATTRSKVIDFFSKVGVTKEMLFEYLSVEKIEEIDSDMVAELRGLATGLKDGTTTVEDVFIKPKLEAEKKAKEQEKLEKANAVAKEKIEQMKKAKEQEQKEVKE